MHAKLTGCAEHQHFRNLACSSFNPTQGQVAGHPNAQFRSVSQPIRGFKHKLEMNFFNLSFNSIKFTI